MGTVAQVCDEVAVMYAGQVVEHSDALSLFSRPRHPYTEGLLRSVPDLRARDAELYSIPGAMPLPGRHPAGCRFAPRCSYAIDECHAAPDAHCIRSTELALAGPLK
jgi:peptide/nickel transport system ATP-binding protein